MKNAVVYPLAVLLAIAPVSSAFARDRHIRSYNAVVVGLIAVGVVVTVGGIGLLIGGARAGKASQPQSNYVPPPDPAPGYYETRQAYYKPPPVYYPDQVYYYGLAPARH
jgi:hypothetical protein